MAKKGYTKIDNYVFAALVNNSLNASELKTLLFIIRYTIGFNRRTTRASYSYIAKGIGMSEDSVRIAIKNLIAKGYITIEYPAIGSKAQVVKLSYENLHTLGMKVLGNKVGEFSDEKVGEFSDQDIKENIKDKTIKKRKASPSFFPNQNINNYTADEAREWQAVLSEEDWKLFLKGKVWQ